MMLEAFGSGRVYYFSPEAHEKYIKDMAQY
jgi:hypothetical protein